MGQVLLRDDQMPSSGPAPASTHTALMTTSAQVQAQAQQPCAVIALPRAGLGLLATIAAGYGWNLHHVQSPYPTKESRKSPWPNRDIAALVEHLPVGSLLTGVIAHDLPAVAALSGLRKILLLRDLRSLLVSRLRAERRSERHDHLIPIWHLRDNAEQMCLFLGKMGPILFDEILSMLPWVSDPEVTTVHFDDLLIPSGDERQRLDDLLSRSLHRLRFSPKSDERISRPSEPWRFDAYWSSEAEAIFTAFGGPQMNRLLGYERTISPHNVPVHNVKSREVDTHA